MVVVLGITADHPHSKEMKTISSPSSYFCTFNLKTFRSRKSFPTYYYEVPGTGNSILEGGNLKSIWSMIISILYSNNNGNLYFLFLLEEFFSLGVSSRKKMPLLWHGLNYCFDPGISSITFAITFIYLSHNVSSIKWGEFCPREATPMTGLIAYTYMIYILSL